MKWKRSKKAQQEAKAKDEAEKRKPTSATSSGNAAVDSKVKEGLQESECGGQQTASSRSVSPSTSSVSAATSLVLEQNFQPQGTATTRVHHLHHHHLQNHHRRLSLQDGGEALYRPYVV
jgi:hypothetical protein